MKILNNEIEIKIQDDVAVARTPLRAIMFGRFRYWGFFSYFGLVMMFISHLYIQIFLRNTLRCRIKPQASQDWGQPKRIPKFLSENFHYPLLKKMSSSNFSRTDYKQLYRVSPKSIFFFPSCKPVPPQLSVGKGVETAPLCGGLRKLEWKFRISFYIIKIFKYIFLKVMVGVICDGEEVQPSVPV